MDFKRFKTLTVQGEEQTLYNQMLAVLLEIKEIKDRFGVSSVEPESKVQRWFSGLNEEEKSNPIDAAQNELLYLNDHILEPLQEKVPILESIGTKLAQLTDRDGRSGEFKEKFLEPTMGSLVAYSSTYFLNVINKALDDQVGADTLKTYMGRYAAMAQAIAMGGKYDEDELMKDLMESLSKFHGQGSIQNNFNAAFDALCEKYEEGRQESRGLKGLLKQLFVRPYVEEIDPEVLTNPFAAESPTAGEAFVETVEGAENQQSTPAAEAAPATAPASPQQRQNPFQKLGQTILSLPVISQIKRGVLGLTAAAVIATEPLQKLINKHRKGLLISGSGVAGVLGLGVLAAKNLGSGPAAPAVDLAEGPSRTPLINIALETIENDFTKTKPSWVSLEAYLGSSNVDIISNNPPNSAAIEQALITLKASMAKGGMASDNQAVKGATRESIEKIAELTGIDKQGFVKAYTDARDAVNDGAHTQAVYHEKMGKALDALSEKITQSRASLRASGDIPVSFSVGHGGGGGDGTLIASANTGGIVSDTPMGILPAQHQSPLATMMQGAVSRLEGVAHNVAVVAQHPAAQVAMRGLGVVGVVASVTATVHAARNGQKSLAVMNAATAVATTAAMAGLPPLAPAMGAARIGAYAADRSGAETLLRVTAQKEKLANKLATLRAEPQTLGSRVQTVTTNVALATKKADVLASQQLNALRENVQSGVEATSQMLTQAQEVTGNAVASTRQNLDKLQQKFASLFNRQATAAL